VSESPLAQPPTPDAATDPHDRGDGAMPSEGRPEQTTEDAGHELPRLRRAPDAHKPEDPR